MFGTRTPPRGMEPYSELLHPPSLKVDIKQKRPEWEILSTDFIPIKNDTYYNYTLQISARDVNQLHSKVFYFDSNRTELGWDFIFGAKDGTFRDTFTNMLK